ncbi:MAG TPA: AgmX/PglI C-terminal domain-containing protein [Myxococcota bacterium]|nr:AgmX/PglI C-terminal domain-containing protein [Myxococcota bacterium]HRY93712.1 AgmX/PglI C-terminal domain-containing protein [Myxococcota bacterium]HSA20630.1 AgmX/PglI C-terminal domain-containing protein [Myxococcota bacterium]
MNKLLIGFGMLLAAGQASAGEGDGLAEGAVQAALRPYAPGLVTCAERQRALDPRVGGKLDVAFTIGKDGRVSKVEVLTPAHRRTYVAGCVDAVLRTVKFPRPVGEPVVVPHLPLQVGRPEDAPPEPEPDEDEVKPPPPPEAAKPARAEVGRKVAGVAGLIKTCIAEQGAPVMDEQPRKGKRKKRAKPKADRIGPVLVTLTINPLGRAEGIEVIAPAHPRDHVAGCVAGALIFVEFPGSEADTLRFSKLPLPKL